MPVVEVREQYGVRSGNLNNKYDRTYTRVFDVRTSSPSVGAIKVRTASGLPLIGFFYDNGLDPMDPDYESDIGSYVGEINAQEVGGPEGAGISWTVTVNYQPWDPSTFGSDPTLWPIRVTFGGERTEKVIDFDRNGVPVRNSAGDRFGDPITIDDHITTLTITRNELVSAFNMELASLYSDTINNAPWNGIGTGQAKMGIISTGEEQFDSNGQVWYYKVTYPVSLKRIPWRRDLLDQGFNELKTPPYGGVKASPIMNGEGQPVADPVALDGSGHRLPIGGTPVTLTFDVFEAVDWSGLNIDLSMRLGL